MQPAVVARLTTTERGEPQLRPEIQASPQTRQAGGMTACATASAASDDPLESVSKVGLTQHAPDNRVRPSS